MASEPCNACPWRDGCPVPPVDPAPDVVFVLNASYRVGETVQVLVRNDGIRTYSYQTLYEACRMTFHTDAGRRFLIPPGTHCDIVNTATLEPGEAVRLFQWDLEECTRDNWGCAEREPLAPGTYHLRDTFCVSDGDSGDCSLGASRSGATLLVTAG